MKHIYNIFTTKHATANYLDQTSTTNSSFTSCIPPEKIQRFKDTEAGYPNEDSKTEKELFHLQQIDLRINFLTFVGKNIQLTS